MAPKEKPQEMHRNHIICLRLTDTEFAFLNESVNRADLSRSDFLRRLILGKRVVTKYEVVADSDEIKKLAGEFGKIGSNLNQIAKFFNSGGERSMAMEDDIRQCISELQQLRKKLLDWQVTLMAIIKHIKSHNSNYSDALEYLMYQHDEKSNKAILDEYGRTAISFSVIPYRQIVPVVWVWLRI